MANLGQGGFDANNVEPPNFDPLPNGKYVAAITDSALESTKAGNGKFLKLVFTVMDGPFKNRTLFARLMREHQNKQAVDIGSAQLSSICRAVSVMLPRDSVELHNLPLVIDVKCKKRKDEGGEGEMQNEIRAYLKKDAATSQQAQPASGGAAPWKR